MNKALAAGIAAALLLAPVAAVAADTGAPDKSERAMTPDSSKPDAAADDKSERAMSKDAGKPSDPSAKSERAMTPDKK